ncbi:hypothetical protein PanWU01x14_363750 [Parasponia andersonii]|uniref:Uncharacterized protein n=1 Tax=Parasponia andersonii TaxID=3476 RepID=A0A2P5A6I6_PARAD|nr:hypothetical protein PanWU01x14_363750 [Parasponia andersonii]
MCTTIDSTNKNPTNEESTHDQEIEIIMESLMKSRVFKDLFDILEFRDNAHREATQATFQVSQQVGPQCCSINQVVGCVSKKDEDTITFLEKDAYTTKKGLSHGVCTDASS